MKGQIMKIKLLRSIPIKGKAAIKKGKKLHVKETKKIFNKREVYIIENEGVEISVFPEECEVLSDKEKI